jgi:hypothetical protein
MSESMTEREQKASYRLMYFFPIFISLYFLIATPIAVVYTKEWNFFDNLLEILTSPSKLVTDYFAVGGLGSTLFNAAICGLSANLIIFISRAKINATIIAGYLLVVAHCFYGLNFLNMWPPFFGIILYCCTMKKKISENVHIAFFSTALAPFVSELFFRYAIGKYDASVTHVNVIGVILALVCGLAIGFVIPALLPGTTAMHRGYNLYKAGLAIGILGIFINAFMYNTLGVKAPEALNVQNEVYYSLQYGYRGFMNVFFVILFTITFIIGFIFNKKSIRGYRSLLRCTGYGTDFTDKFGMPLCTINIALYGMAFLLYLNIVFILPSFWSALPSGVGFTGASVGIIFAALTFAADGQHPKNVFPIAVGYVVLFALVIIICLIADFDIPWTLSSQTHINGLAFATGLCPIAGKYGFRYGMLAGFLSAIICGVTAQMHGGFVLYNGGFNAGLTAMVLIPILDFYHVKPVREDDI